MSVKPVLSWFAHPKNILIAVLGLVAAIEMVLLLAGPSAPPDEAGESDKTAIRVADLTLDMDRMRDLYLEFTYPLGKDSVGMDANASLATLDPEIEGVWTWISPTMLNFKAEEPFAGASEYELALNPPALLGPDETFTGDTLLTFKTGTFNVEQISLEQEPDPSGPAMVTIGGKVRFNAYVDPENLLEHLTLVDPLRGEEDPVPLALLDAYPDRTLTFRSAPLEKTDRSRDLTLIVTRGLLPNMGNIPLAEDVSKQTSLYLNPWLQVQRTNYLPAGNRFDVEVRFTSPVAPEAAGQYITVTPDMPLTFSATGSRLILHGDFLPGREYAVRIESGLRAIDGAVLNEPREIKGTMSNLAPKVDFATQGMFLSARDSRQMVMETVNAPKARLVVDRVYRSNIFALFAHHPWRVFDPTFWDGNLDHALGDRILEREVKFDNPSNEIVRTPLDLGEVIDAEAPGIYRLGLLMPGDYKGPQRWVMVTDIGLVAKQGSDSVLVWAVSHKDLRPLPGVRLTLLSDQNQVMASGSTNAQGMWQAKDLGKAFEKHIPWLVLAERGDDMSFLLFDRFRADMTGLDIAGTTTPSGYLAYAWGERDIYRPGEMVRGVLAVRDATMNTPGPMPLTLVRIDPDGRILGRIAVTTDGQGLAEFEVGVPDYALTGHYMLEIRAGEDVIGEYRYRIEEFIPDRISVDIETPSADLAPGDKLEFTVASSYLFGAPASGLPVEARVELLATDFAPKGLEGYQFGNPDRTFPVRNIHPPGQVEEVRELDEEGNLGFQVSIPSGLRPPAALRAQITARVSERGGRGVSAGQGVIVHPYPYYLGILKPDRKGYDPGQTRQFQYVAVNHDGEPAPHGVLTASLYKDRWLYIRTMTPSGDIDYVTEREEVLLATRTIQAGATEGGFGFTPPIYGSYRVVIEDKDTGASSQVQFYTGGWGYSPWALENPSRLEIVPDKDGYKAGETASFQIRAPFPGKLLVTVEGRDVLETQIVNLPENTGQISLTAKAAYAPNVYVTAVLVRSADDLMDGESGRAIGCTPFFVGLDAGRAEVAVTAPEAIRPQTGIDIEVTAPPGSGVTVAAVDEGILQLIAQETPNPFDFFFAKRGLQVDTMDTFLLLFPEAAALMGASPPGGGEDLEQMKQFVRTESLNRVKPVAFFSGLVTADANGRASLHVDVPEFTGALRVMAVAVKGKTFGAAETLTRVKSPLTVTPTLPRFLAPDETLQVPVVVRNDTENPAMLTVTLTVEGAAIVPEPEQGFMLDPGKEKIVYFGLATGPAEGKVTVRAEVSGADETNGSTTELHVRSAMPFEREALAGSVTDDETELPGVGEVMVPETVSRSLSVGGMPLMRFKDNLSQLLGYPWGCMEQTVSKAFPLLYFEDLAKVMDKELVGSNHVAYVQAAIARARVNQTDRGNYWSWTGWRIDSDYLTVYVAHFLVEARTAGFQVDDDFLNLTLDYLRTMVRQSNPTPYDMTRMAYALYVLAMAGTPDLSSMDLARSKIDHKTRGETVALLAAAYATVGDVKNAKLLLSESIEVSDMKRQQAGDYDSTVRNLGLTVLALLAADPTDQRLPELINSMTQLLQPGRWYTTQENAVALLALGRFFRLQADAPPFSGRVLLGGEELGRFSSDSPLTLKDLPPDDPLTMVMDPGYRPGTVFYTQIIRGAPVPEAYEPLAEGIRVQRELLDRRGDPIDLTAVEQGDLIVIKTDLRSEMDAQVENLALQILLPTGLEVENPRLSSTEVLDWMGGEPLPDPYQDLRDDRVLVFGDLPWDDKYPDRWYTVYSLVRAVSPGRFTLPPVRVEAMYDPSIRASGPVDTIIVKVRQ